MRRSDLPHGSINFQPINSIRQEARNEMSFNDNVPKLKPYSRSVSIIGVGATPFVRVLDDPAVDGLCEPELFGYAARDAMKDAGIDGSDVEFYIHGQAGPGWTSNYATPNMHVANWIGMKAKGSYHHSEACATGYVALETAVQLVASGQYDMVLSGCIEMPLLNRLSHPRAHQAPLRHRRHLP